MRKHISTLALLLVLLPLFSWGQNMTEIEALMHNEAYETAKVQLEGQLTQQLKKKEKLIRYYWLALAQYRMGQIEQAEKTAQQGLKLKKKYPLLLAFQARLKVYHQQPDAALELLSKAEKKNNQKDERLSLELAEIYLNMDEDRQAEARKELYQFEQDGQIDAALILAQYYLRQKAYEAAAYHFELAVGIDSTVVPALVSLAQIFMETQDYEQAANYLNAAIAQNPKYIPLFKLRGEMWLLAENYQQAISDYYTYLQENPEDTQARIRYASALFLNQAWSSALTELEDVLMQAEYPALALRLKAFCQFELGQTQESQATLSKYFERVPAERRIYEDYFYAGKIWLEKEAWTKAVQAFDEALNIDQTQTERYKEIADLWQAKKRYDYQARYLQAWVDHKSDASYQDYFLLGRAYFFSEDYLLAINQFDKVVKLKEDWAIGHYWRGQSSQKLDPRDDTGVLLESTTAVMDLLGDRDLETLTDRESRYLLLSLAYLTLRHSPKPDGSLNCEAIFVYVEKILAIRPDHTLANEIKEACEDRW